MKCPEFFLIEGLNKMPQNIFQKRRREIEKQRRLDLLLAAGDPVIPIARGSPPREAGVQEQADLPPRRGAAYGEEKVLCDCKYCARNNWIPRWKAVEHRARWEMAPLPEVGQSSSGAGGYDSDEVRFLTYHKKISEGIEKKYIIFYICKFTPCIYS